MYLQNNLGVVDATSVVASIRDLIPAAAPPEQRDPDVTPSAGGAPQQQPAGDPAASGEQPAAAGEPPAATRGKSVDSGEGVVLQSEPGQLNRETANKMQRYIEMDTVHHNTSWSHFSMPKLSPKRHGTVEGGGGMGKPLTKNHCCV